MKKNKNILLSLLLAAFGFALIPAASASHCQPGLSVDQADSGRWDSMEINSDLSGVEVTYLLDKNGSPYIISVWCEDPTAATMIRLLTGIQGADGPIPSTTPLGITFYYNHIK